MRTDAIGPRTWLLAALAGWAVLAWLLALFGMGGSIRPLPADPSLVQALPQLRPPAAERLGPMAQYSESGARPLFSESRQPEPFFISGEEGGEQPQSFDFVLSSVLITPALKMAILQKSEGGESVRVKLGEAPESAPNWQLVEINPRSVVIAGPEGRKTLELRVFDGTGGQAPTSMSPPASPMPAGPAQQAPPLRASTAPASDSAKPQPAPIDAASPQAASAAVEPELTTEQQMDLIRKRIEARRAQLREQGQAPPPPPQNKTKTK
jgi:general secretion pathway protein N